VHSEPHVAPVSNELTVRPGSEAPVARRAGSLHAPARNRV